MTDKETLFPLAEQSNVAVTVGSITFDGFPELRDSIQKLVTSMKEVTVNEENVKDNKKLVARVRKEVDSLNDARKRVERHYNEPLDVFKHNIKEVSDLIREAEEFVREQVRALDEQERELKYQEVRNLFDMRIGSYDLKDIFTFEDWYVREFSNKTYSINKVEIELVDWLGKVERDLKFLSEQPDSVRLIAEYRKCQDVVMAAQVVEMEKKKYSELEQRMAQAIVTPTNPDYIAATKKGYTFVIQSVNEANTVREFLRTTGITFTEK